MSVELIDYMPGFKAYKIRNRFAEAVISPHGAHALSYIPNGRPDILWVSKQSNFVPGKPVRGGIPICWPWFGSAGTPAHGTARISEWEMKSFHEEADGSTTITFVLDKTAEQGLVAEAKFLISNSLKVCLTTTNVSNTTFELTEALHTYFAIGDIRHCHVSGLDKCEYRNMLTGERHIREGEIVFRSETDDLYDSNDRIIVIETPARRLRVERYGSNSTIVWNPWIEKSAKMADFGDDEYIKMLCVEAANAGKDSINLPPGASHRLATRITMI